MIVDESATGLSAVWIRGDNKMEKKELKRIPDEDIEKVSGGRRTLRDSEKKDWIRVREKVEEKDPSAQLMGHSI